MYSVPAGEPQGVFHAVTTRDGEGLARDGHPFYEANAKDTAPFGQQLFEVRFGDGLWMLATAADIEWRDRGR